MYIRNKEKTKICQFCKKKFKTTRKRQIYCSYGCYINRFFKQQNTSRKNKKPQWTVRIITTCVVCGKKGLPSKGFRKYCSNECRAKAYIDKRNKPEKIKKCKFCGKPFKGNKSYCSKECNLHGRKEVASNWSKKYHSVYYKTVTKKKRNDAHKEKLKCKQCGKPLPLHASKFCSEECYIDFHYPKLKQRGQVGDYSK